MSIETRTGRTKPPGTGEDRNPARWGRMAALGAVLLPLLLTAPSHVVGRAAASVPAAARPRWVQVGSMTAQRGFATATLLPTGQVLVAGGYNVGALDLTSAEVYNPRTGAFTATGSLTFPTEQQTATLLPSGKVLVVGGANQEVATGLADLYDPTTGTFTSTGGMPDARVDHTATLLRDGRVLVTGGCNGTFFGCTITAATAEVYDPATGTFTATGSMSVARQYHTATLLRDGEVLIAGGASCAVCYTLATAELYNPRTGTFRLTGSLHTARAFHTATLLPDGKVLIAGGCAVIAGTCYPARSALASAELYDPRTGAFSLTGRLPQPVYSQTATLLPDGLVLLAGGAYGPGFQGVAVPYAELYNPRTGRFRATASLHTARYSDVAALLPGGAVLVAGGCPVSGGQCFAPPILSSAEVYVP